MSLQPGDEKLLELARELARTRFKLDAHHVFAAIRTTSGAIFPGVHLEATVGRIAVCAEAVALGNAAVAGDTAVETMVAVNRNGDVVSPCGMCRELILDYAPAAEVIVLGSSGLERVPLASLLPNKYHRLHD